MTQRALGLLMASALAAGMAQAAAGDANRASSPAELAARVAHEIATYPMYGIWDCVNVRIESGRAVLTGAVSQPFKKTDIERIAREATGIEPVTVDLKVLPLSNTDDRLRRQVARAVYGDPALSRYAALASPPIHIIVENGHVTLEGSVSSELEKTVAGLRAGAAGLAFGPVVNHLVVENPPSKRS